MYKLYNTHGVPQCGCEISEFDTWYDLDRYLDENPEIILEIADGYAWIEEEN